MLKNIRKISANIFCINHENVASLVIATAICLSSSGSHGASYEFDNFTIDFDSTITYGVQWRVEERDERISMGSSGAPGQPGMDNLPDLIDNAFILNGNDGNLNFDKGDITANRLSYLGDLDINFGRYGLFARFKAYYDAVYDANDTAMSDVGYTQYNPNPKFAGNYTAAQGNFNPKARDYMRSDLRFLDFFVYSGFDIGDRYLDLRVGRQVIAWGESLLSGGGIAMAQNHVDTQIRNTPGLEIKEMFLPNGAIFAQLDLTDSLNIQAYYQYEWNKHILDPSSSFFSEMDSIGEGGEIFIFASGEEMVALGKNIGDPTKTGDPDTEGGYAAQMVPFMAASATRPCLPDPNDTVVKIKCNYLTPYKLYEEDARDSGQYGISFQFVLEDGAEMGFYYANYHEKAPSFFLPLNAVDEYAPMINMLLDPASAVDKTRPKIFEGPADLGSTLTTDQVATMLNFIGSIPAEGGTIEQILNNIGKLPIEMGSFLDIGDGSLDGFADFSNPGLHVLANETLISDGVTQGIASFVDSINYRIKYFEDTHLWGMSYSTVIGTANFAGEITYRENTPLMRGDVPRTPVREELWNVHLNTLQIFEPNAMWDFATLIAEVVVWHVPGKKNFKLADMIIKENNQDRLAVQNTANGSGVSMLFMMEYRNVFQGVDFVVPIYATYGIDGAMFLNGYRNHQGTISLGLTAKYLDSFEAGIAYANNFGDKDDPFQMMLHDRDTVSFNIKYGF